MVTSNRSINTGFDQKKQMITLEVLQDTALKGVDLKKGETFEASREDAKRLLKSNAQFFKIHMA